MCSSSTQTIQFGLLMLAGQKREFDYVYQLKKIIIL